MPHRGPASSKKHARPKRLAHCTGLLLAALLSACGGGGGPSVSAGDGADTPPPAGGGTPAPITPGTPSAGSKVTMSGQVAIDNGTGTQYFVPVAKDSGTNFGISLIGDMGLYEFKGTLDGATSSTTLGVDFWQSFSLSPDVITLKTAAGTFTCGGLTRRACNGITTTVASDRRSLTFHFDGVVVQTAGQTASRTLTGSATAHFPAAMPYIVPADLPTAHTAALTLDGATLNVGVASVNSFYALPPSASAREFTLSASDVKLSELPWGTANLGDEPMGFFCVTPIESGPCIGLSFEQTPAAATYRFDNVVLKEYRDGVLLAGRRVLDGTLTLPYPQASVNQIGTSHTLDCSGNACRGGNFIYAGGGHIRQSISVEQNIGGPANNGMTSIGYNFDVFNPADRMLTILPGSGDGGFYCMASGTQSLGDCAGVRMEADGMTVVLDAVVVRDLAGNQRTLSGSFKAGGR